MLATFASDRDQQPRFSRSHRHPTAIEVAAFTVAASFHGLPHAQPEAIPSPTRPLPEQRSIVAEQFPVIPAGAADVVAVIGTRGWLFVRAHVREKSSDSWAWTPLGKILGNKPGEQVLSSIGAYQADIVCRSGDGTIPDVLKTLDFLKFESPVPCQLVSLVGVGSIGAAFALLPTSIQGSILMVEVSQPAEGLATTHVALKADNATDLSLAIHDSIFRNYPLVSSSRFVPAPRSPRARWWRETSVRDRLLSEASTQSPVYCYDLKTLQSRCSTLLELGPISRVFFAIKANSNPDLLRAIAGCRRDGSGIGFECVSVGELKHVFEVLGDAIDRSTSILFSPNFAGKEEFMFAYDSSIGYVTIDSAEPIQLWPEVFANRNVIVRVDPGGRGLGHHDNVRTAGKGSKFGVSPADIPALVERCELNHTRIIGLHSHHGSGILDDPAAWTRTAKFLWETASASSLASSVSHLDLGGGIGVPEREDESALDLVHAFDLLERVVDQASSSANPFPALWIEPGRYIAAECGVLLVRVTQVKHKDGVIWVGTNGGFGSLIRPTLYGSYHEIYNLTRISEDRDQMVCHIVGNICESGDFFGRSRELPLTTRPGDILLIDVAGAYGRSMSMEYNMHPLPREVVLA